MLPNVHALFRGQVIPTIADFSATAMLAALGTPDALRKRCQEIPGAALCRLATVIGL
jgi:hypothetical protein